MQRVVFLIFLCCLGALAADYDVTINYYASSTCSSSSLGLTGNLVANAGECTYVSLGSGYSDYFNINTPICGGFTLCRCSSGCYSCSGCDLIPYTAVGSSSSCQLVNGASGAVYVQVKMTSRPLCGGEIAGIVIGCLVGVALIVVCAIPSTRKKMTSCCKKSDQAPAPTPAPPVPSATVGAPEFSAVPGALMPPSTTMYQAAPMIPIGVPMMPVPIVPAAPSAFCPNCRAPLVPNSPICTSCGTPISYPTQTKACYNCQRQCALTAGFCSGCGMKFNVDTGSTIDKSRV